MDVAAEFCGELIESQSLEQFKTGVRQTIKPVVMREWTFDSCGALRGGDVGKRGVGVFRHACSRVVGEISSSPARAAFSSRKSRFQASSM